MVKAVFCQGGRAERGEGWGEALAPALRVGKTEVRRGEREKAESGRVVWAELWLLEWGGVFWRGEGQNEVFIKGEGLESGQRL